MRRMFSEKQVVDVVNKGIESGEVKPTGYYVKHFKKSYPITSRVDLQEPHIEIPYEDLNRKIPINTISIKEKRLLHSFIGILIILSTENDGANWSVSTIGCDEGNFHSNDDEFVGTRLFLKDSNSFIFCTIWNENSDYLNKEMTIEFDYVDLKELITDDYTVELSGYPIPIIDL